MFSVEYDWLNKNRDECLNYRGEYVAVIGTQIVSHSPLLKDVVQETERLYGKGVIPHITKIPPRKEDIPPKPKLNLTNPKNITVLSGHR